MTTVSQDTLDAFKRQARPWLVELIRNTAPATGSGGGSSAALASMSHSDLTNLGADDHTHYLTAGRGDLRYVPLSRLVSAGAGLTGGGYLSANIAITLAQPGTLGVATTNTATGNHTHAVAAADDVSAGLTSLLKSNAGALGVKTLSSTVDLTLSPTQDIVLTPGGAVRLTDGKTIRSASFASGFTGNGFRIDQGVGEAGKTTAEFDNLWVRGRMHVYELLIHQIRATNGSIFVSSTGKAKTVTYISGADWTIVTDPEHGFAVGDLIRAQRWVADGTSATLYQCNMRVKTITNLTTFVATYQSGNSPAAGMEFVRLGNDTDSTRRGGVYMTADDSGAPFVEVFDGIDAFADWNTSAVRRVRFGQLSGVTGVSEYGLWAGDHTAGNLIATGSKVALRTGSSDRIVLDSGGDSYFAGVMTIGTSGEIRQGTVTSGNVRDAWPLTGFTGLRIWRDTNVGRIGGYNNNTLQWYGSTDGRLYGGAGAVYLDSGGLGLTVHPSSLTDTNAVTWRTGGPTGATAAKIGAYASGGTSVLRMQAGSNYLFMASSGYSDFNQTLYLASGGAHAIVATNLGVGLTPDVDTPAASIHIKGSTPKIRIEHSSTGAAILDFVGDSTYTDWGTRFARGSTGANTASYLQHRGTGALILQAYDAGSVELQTQATKRLEVTSDGLVGIGGTPGTNEKLRVSGGTGITVLKVDSSHPSYGPSVQLDSTATSGRAYSIRSSQASETGGAGNFQIVDLDAPAVRWTMNSSGNVQMPGTFTAGNIVLDNPDSADDAVLTIMERTGHPTAPTAADRVLMYMKDNKLFFVFRDTGESVTRHFYLDLDNASGSWLQTTTPP